MPPDFCAPGARLRFEGYSHRRMAVRSRLRRRSFFIQPIKTPGGFGSLHRWLTSPPAATPFWVPSSFVIIAAIIRVFNGWNAADVRRWNARHDWTGPKAAAFEIPKAAHVLRLKVSETNRRIGRPPALVLAAMFATVTITSATIFYAF